MPRRDDIDDIPMLMPDTDEIQAYRSDTSAASTDKARVQSPESSSQREARIRPHTSAARGAAAPSAESTPKRGVGPWLVSVLVIIMMLAGSWWMHDRLVDMEDLLTVSRGELSHARKRIGELEALVVATDVNANKSGTVVQAQVKLMDDRSKERNKFVDSEIDKLWGVSYRTNRPAIAENKKAVENNSVGIKQHTEQLAAQTKLVEKQQQLVANQQQQVVEAVTSAKQAVARVASVNQLMETVQTENAELKAQLAEAQQSLIELSAGAEVVQEGLANVGVKGTTNEQAIAALKQQLEDQIADAKLAASQAVQSAAQTAAANDQSNELAKFSADLNALQTSIANLERKVRIADALERTASELDERLLFAEQDLDAITSFRQATNRKLNQLQEQIRTLQYSE